MFTGEKFYTPLGKLLTSDQVEDEERIVCDHCNLAVIEDEYIPCDDCDSSACLYCWEGDGWKCPACGKVHAAMKAK